ncbi:Bromodomain-containing protein [Cucumispora dikerogammari]|nr:Bromodomain-containing protein [Cucumispora dikerogammari]
MIEDPEIYKQCQSLLQRIYDNPKSEPFQHPVDWKAHKLKDYPEKVKNPIDLSIISTKLSENTYNNIFEFQSDIDLMFSNCLSYNPSRTPIYRQAFDLKKIFKTHFLKIEQMEIAKRPIFSERKKCISILNKITSEKYMKINWLFLEPVDSRQVPTYYDIIKTPMDLKTIRKKIEQNDYQSFEEFSADLELISKNCFKFNAGNPDLLQIGTEFKALVDSFLINNNLKSDEIVEKIKNNKLLIERLTNEILELENQLLVERKHENPDIFYSMEDRIRISSIVAQLDEDNSTKVAKLLHNIDSNIDIFARNYIQLDFKLLKDNVIKEIDEYLRRIGIDYKY